MDTRLLHHISQHQPERQGFNLSRWAIEHTNFTRFLLVLILGSGIFALTNLGQKEDPEFKFRVMIVQVLWPGSSVHEMQEQVVDKIERKIQETPQLDIVQSYTHPGSAVIFVNLKGEARGGEVSDAFYQVRKKVGDIRGALPAGVLGPFFNDEFGDTYIALYALSGEGFTYPELRDFARDARDILLRVPGAGKVDLLGVQDEKLFIEIASRVLAERNISPQDIQAALAGQNSQAPAGTVQTNDRSVRLDVQGTLLNVDQVENLRVRAGSQTIRLSDIATIKRGVEDPPISKIRHDGKESVVLGVVMAKGHNAVNVGEELDAALRRISNVLPVGAQFDKISDQPAVVTKAVSEFLEALGEALLIVLAVSLFSLGWRAGLVVALTIPLVLAATFLVMYIAGIDLQRISLGALIIALGLLVDDAMIAVEMMERKLEEGYGKLSAASFAYNSTAFPMLTGTLITTAGFVPVGFAASTPGEYVQTLFWVVGVSLIASWFAAVYFTPWLGFMLLKERAAPESNRRDVYSTPRYRRLRAAVAWCIRWRKTVVMSAMAAFALAGAGLWVDSAAVFPVHGPARNSSRPLAAGRGVLQGDGGSSDPLRTAPSCGKGHWCGHSLHWRRCSPLLPASRPAVAEPELLAVARLAQKCQGPGRRHRQNASNPRQRFSAPPRQGGPAVLWSACRLAGSVSRARAGSRRNSPNRRRGEEGGRRRCACIQRS